MFIEPVRGHTIFRDHLHIRRADLDFDFLVTRVTKCDAGVQRLVRDLNHLYRGLPALHALDCDPAGFEWIDLGDRDQSVLSYLRRGPEDHQWVMVVCNFTPVPRPAYRVGAPQPGRWVERLNSDAAVYGGSNTGNPSGLAWSTDLPWHGRPYSVELMLPPLGVLVLAWQPDAR